jgi:mycofactocin system FadH/OYE family oxidoreductase 2
MLQGLFTPLQVGRLTLPNRICFMAHRTNFGRQGRLNDRHIAYYRRRARGGCGLITVGELSIHPNDKPWESMIEAYSDTVVADFERLTTAVHNVDVPVFAQLNHHGFQSCGAITRKVVWGPSAIADIAFGENAKAMEPEDMAELTEAFARAATRVRQGGFDGIEIDMGPRSLLRQFLSPISNHRSDEYGGSIENRMRLPLAVVAAVRGAVGTDFTVGIRLTMDEQFWGGIDPEASLPFARQFEDTGNLDFIQVCVGTYYNLHLIRASMHIATGATTQLSAQLKAQSALPVIVGHQIGTPQQAEAAVADNKADAVGFVRPLIADPDFPNKANQGRSHLIRYCVRDNKGCIGRVNQSKAIGCIQNPQVGYEPLEDKPAPTAAQKKTVLVVGAGPAGLEAARAAAQKGHTVTVYEKEVAIGGQTNLHQIAAGRQPVVRVIKYLEAALKELDVPIVTGSNVTAEFVAGQKPDAVIIATGSTPMEKPYPGEYGPPEVLTVWDVLKQTHPVGDRVLFIDEVGGHYSTATVEWLADQSKKIDLISVDLFVGVELAALGDLYLSRQRLLQKGVTFIADAAIDQIQGTTVTAKNIYTNAPIALDNYDTVVLGAGNSASEDLYHQLKGSVQLYRVGDCVAPRGIDMAVMEGRNVGELL